MKDPDIEKLLLIPPQPTDFASAEACWIWEARHQAMRDAAVTWQRALEPGTCFVTKPYFLKMEDTKPCFTCYGELVVSGRRELVGENERWARIFSPMSTAGHVRRIHLSDVAREISRADFVAITTIQLPEALAGAKQDPCMSVSVEDGRFHLEQGAWHWGTSDLTEEGLARLLRDASFDPGVHSLLSLSSVDFPHENGAPKDFDGRLVVDRAVAVVSGRTPPDGAWYPPCVPRPTERSSEEVDEDPAERLH